MGRLRREIAKLRHAAGGRHILLANGTRYRYSREKVAAELFMHTAACVRADYAGQLRPNPAPIMHAVAGALDREAAVTMLYPTWRESRPFTAFDLVTLVETGELRHEEFNPEVPMAAGDE